MIAMPIKSKSEDSAISPVFGKVKYFALVGNGEVKFLENFEKSGVKAIQLLLENGAETLLMSHMGERPFQIALQSGIEVFYVGKDRVTISEAVEKFQNGDFQNAKEVEVSTFNSH